MQESIALMYVVELLRGDHDDDSGGEYDGD